MLSHFDRSHFRIFLEEELDGDREFLEKLVAQHLDDLAELASFLSEKPEPQWSLVKARAHALYPTAKLMGANLMSQALKNLQLLIRDQNLSEAKKIGNEILRAIPVLSQSLLGEVKKLKASA